MSDRCNKKTRKLSAKKSKHRKCYFKMNKTSVTGTGGGAINSIDNSSDDIMSKNQMASSMHQFCIDSNAARKCSLSGKNQKSNSNKYLNGEMGERSVAYTCLHTSGVHLHPYIPNNQQRFHLSRNCWKSITVWLMSDETERKKCNFFLRQHITRTETNKDIIASMNSDKIAWKLYTHTKINLSFRYNKSEICSWLKCRRYSIKHTSQRNSTNKCVFLCVYLRQRLFVNVYLHMLSV